MSAYDFDYGDAEAKRRRTGWDKPPEERDMDLAALQYSRLYQSAAAAQLMGQQQGLGQVSTQTQTFKKTKLCTFHQVGFCPRGSMCTFAHGDEELGMPQPEGGARPMGGGSPGPGPPGPQTSMKIKLCTNWQSGACTRGVSCWFAHGDHELGTPTPGNSTAQMQMQMQTQMQQANPQLQPQPGKIKTKECTHFLSGFCARGDACWFAHGEHQLMTPILSDSFAAPLTFLTPTSAAPPVVYKKTKLCTHFDSGHCPRGDRCTFAHGEAQLGTPQPEGSTKDPLAIMQRMNSNNRVILMNGMGETRVDTRGCTAYVTFMPKDWDDEMLKRHFTHCGQVVSANVLKNQEGESKGVGAVLFQNPRSVMKAMFAMNNFVAAPKKYLGVAPKRNEEAFVPQLPDREGVVWPEAGNANTGPTETEPQLGCTIFIKYTPQHWTEEDLYYAFNHCGQIAQVSDPFKKGYGLIAFVEQLAAVKALKGMNGFNAGEKCFLEISPQRGEEDLFTEILELMRDIPEYVHAARGNSSKVPAGANLYVSGFPAEWTEEDMQREFQGYGQIISLRIMRAPDGTPQKYGFVGFKEVQSAQTAMEQLNELHYPGGVLVVKPHIAREQSDRRVS